MAPTSLTPAQLADFQRDGFLILPGFYDAERDIRPIQLGIYQIIGLMIERYGLPITRPPFTPETFDAGYQELLAADRRYGGEVYDAVKMIPAFIRLVADQRNERLFQELRGTDMAGVAAGGYGIRIDNPNEERFRADWHQEYVFQLRSLDGVVFWSPLLPITPELGPVQLGIGSHVEGVMPVHLTNPNQERQGAYALNIANVQERMERYPLVAPLTKPGDLMIIDFCTVHASGYNTSQRSRWSMQLRYFNFAEPTGMRFGWKGSFAAGHDFTKIHPELVATP